MLRVYNSTVPTGQFGMGHGIRVGNGQYMVPQDAVELFESIPWVKAAIKEGTIVPREEFEDHSFNYSTEAADIESETPTAIEATEGASATPSSLDFDQASAIAKEFGLSKTKLKKLLRAGTIAGYEDGKYAIDEDVLREFLEAPALPPPEPEQGEDGSP